MYLLGVPCVHGYSVQQTACNASKVPLLQATWRGEKCTQLTWLVRHHPYSVRQQQVRSYCTAPYISASSPTLDSSRQDDGTTPLCHMYIIMHAKTATWVLCRPGTCVLRSPVPPSSVRSAWARFRFAGRRDAFTCNHTCAISHKLAGLSQGSSADGPCLF